MTDFSVRQNVTAWKRWRFYLYSSAKLTLTVNLPKFATGLKEDIAEKAVMTIMTIVLLCFKGFSISRRLSHIFFNGWLASRPEFSRPAVALQ